MYSSKIIVEKHPAGMNGIVIGEGDTYEEVVADVTSAIRFHNETFDQGSGDYAR